MVTKRRGKRKSPSAGLVFEVSDEDVSPDNSDSDCNEPESKIQKTDSKFVESVVNALSNLENEEEKTNFLGKEISDEREVNPSENNDEASTCAEKLQETSSAEILCCISPDADFLELNARTTEADFEEGELVTEGVDGKDSPDHMIEINFSNEEISNLYKSKFIKFINTFSDLQIIKEDKLSITLRRDANDWMVLDESNFIDDAIPLPNASENHLQSSNEKTPTKKKKKKKTKKEKELFILDTTPSQHETTGCAKYMSKFNIEINENNEEAIQVSNQVCFNCEQDHALRDCPLPRDHVKINQMRQRFKKDKQTSRYHLEEEQKYAHLRPGTITDKLREALGIKKNQLPPYLYQMRVLGYPPGWLEEAKLVYSNLAMFDTDGNNVRSENTKKNQGLDSNKIIEYPGFNVPLGKDCKDEYRQFRVPPYSENYSKTAMIDYFEKEYSKQQDDFQCQDMEIGEEDDKIEEPVNGKLLKIERSLKDAEKDVPSPSLVDLETQKQTLLAALDDNSNSNLKSEENPDDVPASETHEEIEEPAPPGEEPTSPQPADDGASHEAKEEMDVSMTDILQDTFEEDRSAGTKTVLNSSFGTPILKSRSPYSRLPNPDNFMKDVSPVINFENLPNSTGKYEQMTELLQKVRSTMKNLPKSDSS